MASYELNANIMLQASSYNLGNKKYLNGFPVGRGYYGVLANYTVALKFKYEALIISANPLH
jgi:hypothetical protein